MIGTTTRGRYSQSPGLWRSLSRLEAKQTLPPTLLPLPPARRPFTEPQWETSSGWCPHSRGRKSRLTPPHISDLLSPSDSKLCGGFADQEGVCPLCVLPALGISWPDAPPVPHASHRKEPYSLPTPGVGTGPSFLSPPGWPLLTRCPRDVVGVPGRLETAFVAMMSSLPNPNATKWETHFMGSMRSQVGITCDRSSFLSL